jgi:hypothetical protein
VGDNRPLNGFSMEAGDARVHNGTLGGYMSHSLSHYPVDFSVALLSVQAQQIGESKFINLSLRARVTSRVTRGERKDEGSKVW